MNATTAHHDRIEELLATHAVSGLAPHELHELESLEHRARELQAVSFERAAAAVHLACLGPVSSPLPAAARERLLRASEDFLKDRRNPVLAKITAAPPVAASAPSNGVARPPAHEQPPRVVTLPSARKPFFAAAGWIAAAACLAFALYTASTKVSPGSSAGERDTYQTLLARQDVDRSAWTDWDGPEIRGVTGEVVWCEAEQRGVMVLRGLPPNDPSRQQYQLWIVDRRGLVDEKTGQSNRINGGIFNATGAETIVPIRPSIPVQGAVLFAITIEEPGGTWVSKMDRRVAVAKVARSGPRASR